MVALIVRSGPCVVLPLPILASIIPLWQYLYYRLLLPYYERLSRFSALFLTCLRGDDSFTSPALINLPLGGIWTG